MARTVGLLARVGALPVREAAPSSLLMYLLREMGWHRSVQCKAPVDAHGEPLPWWTYAATSWLEVALRPTHKVFEFGSGNSTLWLADRVGEVHSVEHDAEWADRVRPRLPPHAVLTLVTTAAGGTETGSDDPYLARLESDPGPYDLIVVDGLARNSCAGAAIDHLAADGLVLLDDADRLAFRPAHEILDDAGFGRIDFFGPKPGVGHMSTTSVFSRDFGGWTRHLPPPPPSGY